MVDTLHLSPDLDVVHTGPPLDKGRLPTIFYFALSGRDSLELDPYNQPVAFLKNQPVRIFSLDLPAHGPNESAIDAMGVWAKDFANGQDPISPFIEKIIRTIKILIEKGLVIKEKIALMGLSRGGFIASLVAAKFPVRAVVGFSPLTVLSNAKEFQEVQNNLLVRALNLENHVKTLCSQTIRFYIGNRDTRVGTRNAFLLIEELTEAAYQAGVRSPPIDLILFPSIGHMGHGTPKSIFEAGAQFLATKLGAFR